MIDAHCHLDFAQFDADREILLTQARQKGIRGWVCAGVSVQGWEKQARLSAQHPDIFSAFGLHPYTTCQMSPEKLSDALHLLEKNAKWAIGEMGLDRSRFCSPETLPIQKQAFRAQLALAREKNLPVILHIVGAHGAVLDILHQDALPKAGGMVHSYSGSPALIEQYERLGLYISFSGSITRPHFKKSRAAVAQVSSDKLLVESDCPDQLPYGRTGTRNLPCWLGDTVTAVAHLRGEESGRIIRQTTENAGRLFGVLAWC